MFTNNLKIAWRNLIKQKGFSAINILGLAVGITTCLMISMYVSDELSFDRYHVNGDRIYRLNNIIKFGGTEQYLAQVPDPLGPVLKQDYPQVENFVRFFDRGPFLIKKAGTVNNQREERILFADSSVFEVFTFPLVQGDPHTALINVNSIVLNETSAKRYFKNDNPIGQILTLDNKMDYKITGVMKDIPANSHFTADFFISMNSLDYQWGNFMANNHNTYILLKKGSNPDALNASFTQVIDKYVSPQLLSSMGTGMAEFKKSGSRYEYNMIPLKDIHLKSKYINELGPNGDIKYVYIFSIVALFVLLIACINFMNLSTALASKRAKEVGIRKVLGSVRGQLMLQFFSECVLISFLGLAIALVSLKMLLPFFNDISGKSLSIQQVVNFKSLTVVLLMPILVGIIAGSYPAVFLSSFEPIKVLKGKLGLKSGLLRNSLVTFQFAASIILIISTIVIYRQIDFMQKKKLGYVKEHVLIINDAYALGKNAKSFKEDILRLPGVISGTLSGYLPTPSNRDNGAMFAEGELDKSKGVIVEHWHVDEDYIKTLGMEITAGRDFSKEYIGDSSAVILNETAAKLFGFKDPINKSINYNGAGTNYRVIGIVKDFHFESMHDQIGAIVLLLNLSRGNVSFRLDAKQDLKSTVKSIESKWNALAPGQPFSYNFMDDSFNAMFNNERRIGKLALSFAVLTIFVACLGLFGLVTFIAEQRIKEIGIRKILGAGVSSIVRLFAMDFVKLILVSLFVAIPLAYYLMNRWIQEFVYRSEISWWIFGLAGAGAICIALITISIQAIKAAVANPIKSLRSE